MSSGLFVQFQRVRLITDRFAAEGARRGMTGYILERWVENAYEVEFSDSAGTTIAQIVATAADLESAEVGNP